LSLTDKLALRLPVALGVNVTGIVQLAPAASDVGQLLVWAKSPAFVPPIAMLATLSEAVPELVSVTVWAALVVPVV
jgi:hypothetical protein